VAAMVALDEADLGNAVNLHNTEHLFLPNDIPNCCNVITGFNHQPCHVGLIGKKYILMS